MTDYNEIGDIHLHLSYCLPFCACENQFLFSLFQKNHRPKYVSCIAFSVNGDVLTGDTDGSICVWPEGLCTRPSLGALVLVSV